VALYRGLSTAYTPRLARRGLRRRWASKPWQRSSGASAGTLGRSWMARAR